MIRHIWSVLCSQSVIDAQSNNVSLFNVIEQLTVVMKKTIIPEGKIPLLPISLELVTLWERGELEQGGSRAMWRSTSLDPTGKRLGGQDINVDVSAARRCRTKLAFGGIPSLPLDATLCACLFAKMQTTNQVSLLRSP